MSFFKQKESKPQTENLAVKTTSEIKTTNEVKEAPLKEASMNKDQVLTLRERLGMINNAKASPLLNQADSSSNQPQRTIIQKHDTSDAEFRKEVAMI